MTALRMMVSPPLGESPQMLIFDPDMIRANREVRGISLRRLAKVCECSYQAIADYESGKTKTIPEKRANLLAIILGFPFESAFRPNGEFVMPGATSDSGMAESA